MTPKCFALKPTHLLLCTLFIFCCYISSQHSKNRQTEKIGYAFAHAHRGNYQNENDLLSVNSAWFKSLQHAVVVNTQNFNERVIEGSKNGNIVLVTFFDPLSESFGSLRHVFEETAKIINETPSLRDRVTIGLVNCAIDTYLPVRYAPEIELTSQDPKEEDAPFTFGDHNYYAMITKLFRDGVVVEEVPGEVTSDTMIAYVRRQLSPVAHSLNTKRAVDEFTENMRPSAIGCFPDSCDVFRNLFINVSQSNHGLVYYGVLSDEKLCESFHSGFTKCQIVILDTDKNTSPKFFSQTNASDFGFDDFALRQEWRTSLVSFIAKQRHPIIVKLTPDNAWEFQELYKQLVVLLIPQDPAEAEKATKVFREIGANFDTYSASRFMWADGKFASQFGVSRGNLPSVFVFDTETADVTIFDRNGNDLEVNRVTTWLKSLLREPNLTVSNANDDAKVKDTCEAHSCDETTESQPKQQFGKAMLSNVSHYKAMEMSKLWSIISVYLNDVLDYEIAYHHMSQEERDNEKQLRNSLDQVWRLMYANPVIGTALAAAKPKTPVELKNLLAHDDTRKRLFDDIERLEVLRVSFERQKDELMRDSIAQLCTDLFTFLVQIRRKREEPMKIKGIETSRTVFEIERRSAINLSLEEFITEYANLRKPVVITDLHMFSVPWTNEYIQTKCGNHKPELNMRSTGAATWGGLVKVKEEITLFDFMNTFNKNLTRRQWYLHDWSLPKECPEIMGEHPPYDNFYVPKYFAGDYFQRLPFIGYQHTWPSLFIGSNGTQSALHVDSGGTNFWMYLIEGKKEWRFFNYFDKVNLYPRPDSNHFEFDVFEDNINDFPLVKKANMYMTIQNPGELIFIPGGCPHGVRNHADITAISMNYLDSSNFWLYLWTQLMEENYRDFELYSHSQFPIGLNKSQKDVSFGEFKSTPWFDNVHNLDLF